MRNAQGCAVRMLGACCLVSAYRCDSVAEVLIESVCKDIQQDKDIHQEDELPKKKKRTKQKMNQRLRMSGKMKMPTKKMETK